MKEIREMILVLMDAKKTVAVEIRECKHLKERLHLVEEEVEQEVEMRRKTHTQQSISEEEESSVAKLVAAFLKKAVERHRGKYLNRHQTQQQQQ